MKSYKLFKYDQFINESNEDIHSICKKYRIENYTINEDGTVDVDGNVDLSYRGLERIPLKFGKVTDYFDCSNNKLTSLEGCPSEVGGHFTCAWNQLTSLEGCPQEVTSLNCSKNNLVDVKGFPKVRNSINIYNNPVYNVFRLFIGGPRLVLTPMILSSDIKEIVEYLNEYNVIRDGNKVVMQALEVVYDELGIEVPEEIEIKGYEII